MPRARFSRIGRGGADEPIAFDPVVEHDCAARAACSVPGKIAAAAAQIKVATLNRAINQNLLLPQLALVFDSTLYGLRGDYDIGGAFSDQFALGSPTYSVGLVFEYPLGNQTALARHRRSQLEVARETAMMVDVIQQVRLDVQTAIIDLDAAYRAMAQDEAREAEALEWAEATIGDVSDATR